MRVCFNLNSGNEILSLKPGNIASIVVQKVFKTDFNVAHETDAHYASKKH